MKSRKWWLFASLCIFVMVTGLVLMLEEEAQLEQKTVAQYLPPVSVFKTEPQNNRGSIQAFAEIEPRWATMLNAQVNGEITKIFGHAAAGEVVEKGDVLLQIEDTLYQSNLREAEQALSEAKLNLLQEQNKSTQALKDWQRSGIAAIPTALALNKPQQEVAQKAVSAAESLVNAARKNFAYTQVKAPFSGVITERHVSIGQIVTEGEALLHIVHQAQQELVVALSQRQWGLLVEEWRNQFASIRNSSGVEIARARIKRGGGFIDPETRQYKLFLEVDDKSNQQLMVGDFVQVVLPGRVVGNSLAVPESALTRDGLVWYLDDKDRLRHFFANVLFHLDDKIVIETPSLETLDKYYPSNWRICTTPLASFLAGKQVNPVTVTGE